MLSSHTRSGGGAAVTDGLEAALNVVLASGGELEHDTAAHESVTNFSAMKEALVKPGGGMVTTYPSSLKVAAKPWSRQSRNAGKQWKKRRIASSTKESRRSARAPRER